MFGKDAGALWLWVHISEDLSASIHGAITNTNVIIKFLNSTQNTTARACLLCEDGTLFLNDVDRKEEKDTTEKTGPQLLQKPVFLPNRNTICAVDDNDDSLPAATTEKSGKNG